jgi:hypothetical protein
LAAIIKSHGRLQQIRDAPLLLLQDGVDGFRDPKDDRVPSVRRGIDQFRVRDLVIIPRSLGYCGCSRICGS